MPNAWLALWCDELDACDADLSIGTGDSERGIAPAPTSALGTGDTAGGAFVLLGETLSARSLPFAVFT